MSDIRTSETVPEIRMVPVTSITVLNPRARNRKVFAELVASISHLGLKKPITVSRRADGSGYDLVCGQGRLEAFIELGQTEIPAVLIEAAAEDCFVMSLVENLARRQHSSMELMDQIGALKKRGYSLAEIAAKTDFSPEYIWSICHLLENGEQRLLKAVERGEMPHSIAMEIARAEERDVQQALMEAYESRSMPGNQVLAIRRIIEQRNSLGKATRARPGGTGSRKRVTADSLIRAYRKETDRQKLLIKKATVARERLEFVVQALANLLADDVFPVLLRAEGLPTMPRSLAERVAARGR